MNTCESCGAEQPFLGLVHLGRRRAAKVCIFCLAESIQLATGWKMVQLVRQYALSTVNADEISRASKLAASAARGDAESLGL